MRKELLVVLSVVRVSEILVLSEVAAAEGLLTGAEELAMEVASPTVDPATLGTVTVPKTSVWLCVSIETAEVSFKGFLLTVTKVPEVGVWAAVVSLWVVPLVGSVPSRAVAKAEMLAVDKVSEELVVKGGKAGTVELVFVSEVSEMMADVSISVIQVVSLMWVILKATKSLAGAAVSGPRACELLRTPAELSEEELLSEDRCSASLEVCAKVKRSIVIILASSELSSVQRVTKVASMGSLTVPVLTVLVPVLGLPLVANISVGVVCTTMKLGGVLIGGVLVSGTEEMVWVFRVISPGEMVFFSRVSVTGEEVWVSRDDGAGEEVWVSRVNGAGEVVWVFRVDGAGGDFWVSRDDGVVELD